MSQQINQARSSDAYSNFDIPQICGCINDLSVCIGGGSRGATNCLNLVMCLSHISRKYGSYFKDFMVKSLFLGAVKIFEVKTSTKLWSEPMEVLFLYGSIRIIVVVQPLCRVFRCCFLNAMRSGRAGQRRGDLDKLCRYARSDRGWSGPKIPRNSRSMAFSLLLP